MASSSSSSSSSSSLASHTLKYDVFLNFRGEDTRRGFTRHLYLALRRKALQTFFDDDDLKRGEAIALALPRAIQDSTVAVLVFSKDYASSRWCLDELAEIMECHRSHGQIVIPVFYEINPSHLRKQSDDVAAAFVKHEQNPINDADKIQQWRVALTEAANLSGFDSKNFGNDDLLIKEIVKDISKKLNQPVPPDDFEHLVGTEHLVGMDSRIEEIKEKFTINPSEARILGIWGMGGAGKTTMAKVIYHNMSHQFQGYCFVHKVRQIADIHKLKEELILQVLGEEDSGQYRFNAIPNPSLQTRLGRMKVLIVLDDVNNRDQIISLIGNPCWFGPGSMILITSRDRLVFDGWADFTHKVKLLNVDEAIQLFSKKAFEQNHPRDDYEASSKSIVEYAQGNPLALEVLGSALKGENREKWDITSTQLSQVKDINILKVLQISFEDLDPVDKDIFLDIACFFKHTEQIYVLEDSLRKVYKSRRFNIDKTLSVLANKCLVTVLADSLDMHDLLQEMAEEIVRRLHKPSRLWDPDDIYEIFAGNKEAEAVETITLDLSKIREMDLNPQVFRKMPNLRFLNFYGKSKLHLSQGLGYLPNTLQLLRWVKCPLESLPPNSLVVLELPNSNMKQLRIRDKEDSLLSQVKYGIVNIFWRLTTLILVENKSITCLPDGRSGILEALEVLDLSGCSNLNTFPEISSNIKELNLNKTAIKQVPSSSVQLLSKLEALHMRECKELESLPSNFFSKSTSLSTFYLCDCSRLKVLPEIGEPRSRSMFLQLSRTAIQKLPSIIGNSGGSWTIVISFCSKFAFFPISSENCLPEDSDWEVKLVLSRCHLRKLPEDLCFPSFITSLDLSDNDFERIPATFIQLPRLRVLKISGCKRLLSLPELPSNVHQLEANFCTSLKEIWTLKQLSLDSRMNDYYFSLSNCSKLDEDECQEVVNALLRNYTRSQMQESSVKFEMIYPGSRIPEWVTNQNMGHSIQIHLPSHWFNNLFLGFAFYLCHSSINVRHSPFRYDCYLGDNYYCSYDSFDKCPLRPVILGPNHMEVFIDREFCKWVDRHGNFEENVAVFKFFGICSIVTKCGVFPLYAQNEADKLRGTFDLSNLGVFKLKRSAISAGSFHCMPEKRLTIEEVNEINSSSMLQLDQGTVRSSRWMVYTKTKLREIASKV